MWGLLICSSASVFASIAEKSTIKRYALVTASNNGGGDRVQLRYAESDALAISKVFREIGGVSSTNSTVLLSPGKAQLEDTLKNVRERIQNEIKTSERAEFIFYYSGHSDETGLLLKDGKYSYKDLRAEINAVGADIKIAILDSCQSGAFTRLKGGVRSAPFLVNSANKITGSVFLAASSASEASQESDAIGASFFTHYFVSALRGASDVSGDQQITLNEAYQYAYNETLAQTEISQAGAQHPEYNIQIAGAGDIVLTDVNTSSSTLTIPQDIIGRFYIRDPSGALILELNKVSRKAISVALDPNKYSVVLERNPETYRSSLTLGVGENLAMNMSDFGLIEKKRYQTRGNVGFSRSETNHLEKLWRRKLNQFSVGFMTAHIDLPAQDWGHQIRPALELNYTGYAISYSRLYRKKMLLDFEFYEMQGDGVMRGYSLGIKKYIRLWRDGERDIDSYIGISPFIEKLTGVPEEYTINSTWAERNLGTNRFGIYIPLGINLVTDNKINIDIFTRIKWVNGYSISYYRTVSDFFSGTGLKLGYSF